MYGLAGPHDRLPSPDAEAEQGFRARYADIAALAETATGDPVTRDVVIRLALAQVDLIDARLPKFTVSNAFAGGVAGLLLDRSVLTLDDGEKAEGYLARPAAVPSYVDGFVERQRGQPVPPAFLVDLAVSALDRYFCGPLRIAGSTVEFAAERDPVLDAHVCR